MEALYGYVPKQLAISRSLPARLSRLMLAGGVILCWLSLGVMDLVFSVMFFSEPHPEILLYASPMLAVVPWILGMASARGRVVVHADHLEIRHRRVLKRAIFLHRHEVRRILIDDGAITGRARFPTGDKNEPLLWTDPVPRKQHGDRPLIGDAILPNLAIVPVVPLRMTMARGALAAIPVDIDPPPRGADARALLLSMENLEAVRAALADWPVSEPDVLADAIPSEVADAATRVEADASIMVAFATATGLTVVAAPMLAPIPFAASLYFVWRMMKRRHEAEARARAEVAGRTGWETAERTTAVAAIDANFGRAHSEGPPS